MFKSNAILINKQGEEIYCPNGFWGKAYIIELAETKDTITRYTRLLWMFSIITIFAAIYFKSWIVFVVLLLASEIFHKGFVKRVARNLKVSEKKATFNDYCYTFNRKVNLLSLVIFEIITIGGILPFTVYRAFSFPDEFIYYSLGIVAQILIALLIGYCIYLKTKKD